MLPVSALPERPRIASKLAPTRAEWRSRSLSVRVFAAASVAVALRTGLQPGPSCAVAERNSGSGRGEHSRHAGLTSRRPWRAVRRPRAPSFVLPVSALPERPRIASKLAPTRAGRRSRSLSVRAAYVGATLVAIKDPSWLLARRPRIASKLAPTGAERRNRSPRASCLCRSELARDHGPFVAADCQQSVCLQPSGHGPLGLLTGSRPGTPSSAHGPAPQRSGCTWAVPSS